MLSWLKSSAGWSQRIEALGQILHQIPTFGLAHGKPIADLLEGTAASKAQPANGIVGTDLHTRCLHVAGI